jgi:LysR family transcriptional regulator, low CO2-responsive transcriptional regulator
MQLEQLVAFDRVARAGSFSRAALALGLGQPAISSRILALEDAVGGALFLRGRAIRLTALGESFLPYARRALEVLREGVDASRLAQVGERGSVRIGSLSSLAGGLIGPALAEFVRTHPQVECAIKSAAHEILLQLLLDGIIDVALTLWPSTSAVDLTAIFVFREPVVLVAHPRHPLARSRRAPATTSRGWRARFCASAGGRRIIRWSRSSRTARRRRSRWRWSRAGTWS